MVKIKSSNKVFHGTFQREQLAENQRRSFQEWQGKLKKSPFFSTVTLGKIRKDPVTGHEGIIQLEMNHDTNRQE